MGPPGSCRLLCLHSSNPPSGGGVSAAGLRRTRPAAAAGALHERLSPVGLCSSLLLPAPPEAHIRNRSAPLPGGISLVSVPVRTPDVGAAPPRPCLLLLPKTWNKVTDPAVLLNRGHDTVKDKRVNVMLKRGAEERLPKECDLQGP